MNTALYVGIAAAAAAMLTPLVTLFIARHRMSGSISTSDATALWESANELRKDLLERIRQLNVRQIELENYIITLEDEKHKLEVENIRLRVKYGEQNG